MAALHHLSVVVLSVLVLAMPRFASIPFISAQQGATEAPASAKTWLDKRQAWKTTYDWPKSSRWRTSASV